MSFTGNKAVQRKLKNLQKRMLSSAARGLVEEAEEIEQESRERTPVESGALRDSHKVSKSSIRGNAASVTIGAGGSLPYAVRVHEGEGGEKFLQSAALEAERGLVSRLKNRINLRRMVR